MTAFDKRRDELEKKYFHDQELAFKAKSRRNKLLGLLVAERIGKSGEEATEYARKLVVAAALAPSGDDALHGLIAGDLEAAGKPLAARELNAILDTLMTRAVQEIQGGG